MIQHEGAVTHYEPIRIENRKAEEKKNEVKWAHLASDTRNHRPSPVYGLAFFPFASARAAAALAAASAGSAVAFPPPSVVPPEGVGLAGAPDDDDVLPELWCPEARR